MEAVLCKDSFQLMMNKMRRGHVLLFAKYLVLSVEAQEW